MARVLLVDDDPEQLEMRQLVLEDAGHQVRCAGNAAEARQRLAEEKPRLMVMDLRLPRPEDGRELIRHTREHAPEARIVVLTGHTPDLLSSPEARLVDHVLSKPVRSAKLVQLLSKLAMLLLVAYPAAGQIGTYPFQVSEPAEVVAEIEMSAPGGDWGRPGREAVLAEVTLNDGAKQHVMVYAGGIRYKYPVFLGALEAGPHQIKIDRHTEYSARGLQAQVHGVTFRQIKAGDADYAVIANAPVIFARQNTIGKFSDIPLVTYCERLGDGSLRYSVIFSNEDGGTSTRALMARWGRVTDIEHVYQVWPDKDGKPLKALIQTRDHKDIPFDGKREGMHPLLGVVTDNNMVAANPASAVRYQQAPQIVALGAVSREQVMDDHPITYLISSRELEREGKLRQFGTVEGTKISAPENYLVLEMRVTNKDARVAVLVRMEGDNFWRSSHLGVHAMGIERSGWVRTALELPPATQPPQVAEIALQCLPEEKSDGGGSCRVEGIGKMFFLDANQRPGANFWRPRIDRGPWVVAPGQMRVIPVK